MIRVALSFCLLLVLSAPAFAQDINKQILDEIGKINKRLDALESKTDSLEASFARLSAPPPQQGPKVLMAAGDCANGSCGTSMSAMRSSSSYSMMSGMSMGAGGCASGSCGTGVGGRGLFRRR